MPTPMIGDWTVRVEAVRPFAIHGDLYYELHVQATGDASGVLTTIRVPQHAATEEPTAGQTLTITFLMGQVTSVKRVDTV